MTIEDKVEAIKQIALLAGIAHDMEKLVDDIKLPVELRRRAERILNDSIDASNRMHGYL